MQPEEQQRIMGYFIEEAKDHLNTIEQGLLSLQATIEDAEKANEVFRAAHSVKGGAAMLGLESIQKTAHRMEDYFKILKESPVRVDRVLETMFLRISDGLKDLLEHLEGPFGLTQDKAQEIMADVEPVFGQIEAHLNTLVGKSVEKIGLTEDQASINSLDSAKVRFKRDGASFLRKMLAAFKRPDNADSRKAIQDICTQLYDMGEQFELFAWCDLIETARLAAASLDNDYRALAPVLIKEIKQAQDLVLSGRASEIAVSEDMQVLLPEDILEEDTATEGLEGIDDFDLEASLEDSLHGLDFASDGMLEDDFDADDSSANDLEEDSSLFGEIDGTSEIAVSRADENDVLGDLFGEDSELEESDLNEPVSVEAGRDDDKRLSLDLDFDEIPSELSALDRDAQSQEKADESLDALLATVNVTGPEVGEDELNSLADLFDGDLEELDNTLGGHAFVSEEMQLHPEKIDIDQEDDFTDLLSNDTDIEKAESAGDDEIEDDLFGGTLTDGEFAIADSADDFNEVDFSKDPWGENDLIDTSSVANDTLNAKDDIFNTDLDSIDLDVDDVAVDMADLAVDEERGSLETWDLVENVDSISEDLELEALSVKEQPDAIENGLDELLESDPINSDPINTKGSILTQLPPSHTVSPKIEEIDFPTLTGQKLQEAEENIDSFFLGEDEDETPEQLSDNPWGEIESDPVGANVDAFEAGTTISESVSEEPETAELEPITSTLESASFDLDSIAKNTETAAVDREALETAFLDVAPSASFEVDLDIEQAGAELEELLENGEQTVPNALSVDKTTDDLWDELVSDPTDDDPNAELDLETSLLDSAQSDPDRESSESALPVEKDLELDFDDLDANDLDLDMEELSPTRADADLFGDIKSVSEISPEDRAFEDLDFGDVDAKAEPSPKETEPKQPDVSFFDLSDLGENDSQVELLDIAGELGTDNVACEIPEIDNPEIDNPEIDNPEIDNIEEIGETIEETSLKDDVTSELVSKDISGDELSEEVLADFETAFGTGVFAEVASDEMLFEGENEQKSEQKSADSVADAEGDALDISELEIDGLLDEGLDEELDGFLTEDELAEIDGSLPDLDTYGNDNMGDRSAETASSGRAAVGSQKSSKDGDRAAELRATDSLECHSDEAADFTDNDFDDLDVLLSGDVEESVVETGKVAESIASLPTFVSEHLAKEHSSADEDFGDLERLLEDGPSEGSVSPPPRRSAQVAARRGGIREQTMRVSVSHLDTLSNLVGELVVSRNTLERDQERLRQFLDNLLFQVQQLNDVGQRLRDLYERSLLESSLMSNRRAHNSARSAASHSDDDPTSFFEDHATGETFDALEMDRFTGFHTLSQEMIELIVRVRESSSDIGYTVESSDQVTRQFRQITTQLQEGLNTARMVAFSQAADRLPRAVRDISLKCGKEARLIVEGQDTLIDKMIVEHLYDPLTHLVNNAITHGIEMPEDRKAAGKSAEGSITVRAFYQGNQTVIYVADDGGGINTDFVKRKAIEKKLITQAEAVDLTDIETYDLLFHPGFSTRDQADDFAGRGVGMDVVRTSLAEIRGSITIDSELGKGTSFTIRLPLTLSISKALSCVSNQARIAFPMDGVEDMLDVPRDRIVKNDQGQDCIRWRDILLSFQPVTDLLRFNRTLGRSRVYGGSQEDDILSIIVLRSANTYIAVQVDQVIGEQEIVIKQLEGPVPKPLGIAGATVLGDGRVMPIADVIELIDIAMGRVRREPSSMLWVQDEAAVVEDTPIKQEPTVLIVDDSITVRELLSMSFNKVGYRVEQARDGQEAWDKLRSGLPCDLVFCDIEMPRMDGLELLSRMQKDSHLKSIPIAMLTSRGADRHRQMAVDLGASGYFTKPYLEEALLDAAQRMLNGETLAKGRGG